MACACEKKVNGKYTENRENFEPKEQSGLGKIISAIFRFIAAFIIATVVNLFVPFAVYYFIIKNAVIGGVVINLNTQKLLNLTKK